MCNRYVAPAQGDIERHWQLGARQPVSRWAQGVYPRAPGPFIRARDGQREPVVGQWALVPHFAKAAKLSYQTHNARSEELAQKASYRGPWQRGQRCVIPAWAFDEPCWETGRNVWWSFRRADGQPWGLAGLWNTWVDPATGEVVESYTMLTLNADAHPLMRRMHKPDPSLGPDRQDKRSVVPIEPADVDAWLHGGLQQATALLRLAPVEVFSAMPAPADPPGAPCAPGGGAPPIQPSLL
ncbi:MAG: SOS response-associated peptidase [Rubrivivax sp.]|jgi:putative SOS response-associated peptidase YedK